ncbi:hypothetical protein FRC03_007759 [Tulasnella sp. 419]|nr:hypothetical protein FRC03_007759 [Tulasnella sp. 419]
MSYTFSNSPTPDAPLSATSTESDNSAYSVRSSMNNTDSQVQDGPKLPNGTPWNTMNNGFNPNQPHHFQQRQFSQGVAQHQSQLIPPSHPGAMPNMRHVQGANPLIMQQQQQQRPPQMAQQNLPQNVADLQNLQNKTLAQNYNQMQQRLMAQHQQQQLFGGAAGGPMAGLTPYQQQQAMIQIQQQQQQHQAQQQLQQQQQQMMAAQRQMQQAQQAQQHLQQQHQQAMNGLGQQVSVVCQPVDDSGLNKNLLFEKDWAPAYRNVRASPSATTSTSSATSWNGHQSSNDVQCPITTTPTHRSTICSISTCSFIHSSAPNHRPTFTCSFHEFLG